MIIPIVEGVKKPSKVPLTYVLVLLNLMIFIFMEYQFPNVDEGIQTVLNQDEFIQTNANVYAQYSKDDSRSSRPFMEHLFHLVRTGDDRAQTLVSQQLALQDIEFLNRAPAQSWSGDQVAIQNWKKSMKELDILRAEHPLYVFGLSARAFKFDQLITYQFAHSGWSHFLFNMIFLIIFGTYLETRMKSFRYLQLFLIGGAIAGISFLWASQATSAPLVGASGSIGALIGASLYHLRGQKVRYFAYVGVFQFPFWIWFFYFWVLVDFTGIVRSMDGMGSQVAHVAHIGGSIAGYFLAQLYSKGEKKAPRSKRDAFILDSHSLVAFFFARGETSPYRVLNNNSFVHELF